MCMCYRCVLVSVCWPVCVCVCVCVCVFTEKSWCVCMCVYVCTCMCMYVFMGCVPACILRVRDPCCVKGGWPNTQHYLPVKSCHLCFSASCGVNLAWLPACLLCIGIATKKNFFHDIHMQSSVDTTGHINVSSSERCPYFRG